jgi:excisionase family DNA binding protein
MKQKSAVKKKERSTPLPVAVSGQLLEMNEAIAVLKTTRPTFYRWVRAGKIRGTKIGRQWRFERTEIERFLKGEAPQIDLPSDITPLIETLRERLGKSESVEPREGKVAWTIQLMIEVAEKLHGDIHIEPRENSAIIRYRLDGVLCEVASFDLRLLPAIIRQWKTMANCDVHETVRPQDGRITLELGNGKKKLDLRLCFLPAALGEALTVRVLDQEAVYLSLNRLEFAEADKKKLQKWLAAPWGMIVVTGPTGCGKTSTLYACLNQITSDSPGLKVMTIEDPVEYLLPGTTQVAVRPQSDLTHASLLRAFLRSDPNVILISEMRDRETIMLAQQAALTGHLVLTTMHTTEAATALRRMIEIGVNPFVAADATKLVVAQRLVRVLCPKCSVARQPAEHFLTLAQKLARLSGRDWKAYAKSFREPVGCKHCHMTGFRGRTVIAEALEMTPAICGALLSGASATELRTIAIGEGMSTIAVDGMRRVAEGKTSLGEIMTAVALIYEAELDPQAANLDKLLR